MNTKPLLLLLTIVFPLIILNCKSKSSLKKYSTNNDYISTTSGLQYKVLQEGAGDMAEEGDAVMLRETTTYLDGTMIYTNEENGNAIKVILRAGMVTKGVEEGLMSMKQGEIKSIIVPPQLSKNYLPR